MFSFLSTTVQTGLTETDTTVEAEIIGTCMLLKAGALQDPETNMEEEGVANAGPEEEKVETEAPTPLTLTCR